MEEELAGQQEAHVLPYWPIGAPRDFGEQIGEATAKLEPQLHAGCHVDMWERESWASLLTEDRSNPENDNSGR